MCAWRQHGAVAIWQVVEQGLGPDAFRQRARREGWTRDVRGVWRPPGAAPTRLQRLSVALLAGGPDALVTGVDGLWLHGLKFRVPTTPRIVVPMDRHAARHLVPDLKVISSRTLRSEDATVAKRLAVAVPERCFVDLVIPPTPAVSDVRDMLVTARQARRVDLLGLRRALDRARGVPGINVLRRAVADIIEVEADSPFSDRVHRRLRAQGLRPDPRPAAVQTPGRELHPDITFAHRHVAIECDSMLAHSSQRDLMIDNRKDRAYLAAGWVPLRIGPLEFDTCWDDFVADLRRSLHSA